MRAAALLLAAAVLAGPALADTPPKGAVAGVVVDARSAAPLAGATVILTSDQGHIVIAGLSDAEGRFRMGNLPTGSYQVLFVLGTATDLHTSVPVTDGLTTPVHGELAPTVDVTTIVEHPIQTAPRPIRSTVKKVLPYSDAAIDHDAWEVGWLLLDIDTRGEVESFRFLHRPGHDLERIANQEVWKLRFEPARGVDGKPVPSQMLWKMEWPSFWWSKEVQLVNHVEYTYGSSIKATRRAPILRPGFMTRPYGTGLPPCKGEGPLNLESAHAVYRDCSKPDLANVDAQPVVVRPAAR